MINFDEEYILKITKGDERALERIIDIYTDLIAYIVKNIIGAVSTNGDIEECVSDVFYFIWCNANKYNPSKGTVRTWIAMCARYKALDYRKKINKTVKIIGFDDINDLRWESNVEECVLNKDLSDQILNIVNTFDEIDKNVFYNRYFLHIDIVEIAQTFCVSREAIDNRLWRCRNKIKESIKFYEGRV